jgi:hypothetical protein
MALQIEPVQARLRVQLFLTSGRIDLFDSKFQDILLKNAFQGSFGGYTPVPAGAVDQAVSLEGLAYAQIIYLVASQPLQVKLAPYGSTNLNTPALTLYQNVPSLISVTNLTGIYLSNPTNVLSNCIVAGAAILNP